MKVEDLRIGNTIALQEKPITVNLTTLERLYSKNPKYYGNYNPILLTPEWLGRFGFDIIGEKLFCNRYRKNRVDIYKMISGDYPFYFRFNQVDLQIQYVHQLQNLYFALTGQELTYNNGTN